MCASGVTSALTATPPPPPYLPPVPLGMRPLRRLPSRPQEEGAIKILTPEILKVVFKQITALSDQWSLRFVSRGWSNTVAELIRSKDAICPLEEMRGFLQFVQTQLNERDHQEKMGAIQWLEHTLESRFQSSPLFGPRGDMIVLEILYKIMEDVGEDVNRSIQINSPPLKCAEIYQEMSQCRSIVLNSVSADFYDGAFFDALDRLITLKDSQIVPFLVSQEKLPRKCYSAFLLQGDLQRAQDVYCRIVRGGMFSLVKGMEAELLTHVLKQQGIESPSWGIPAAPHLIQSLTTEARFLMKGDLFVAACQQSPKKAIDALLKIGKCLDEVEGELQERRELGRQWYLGYGDTENFFCETRRVSRKEGSTFLQWMKEGIVTEMAEGLVMEVDKELQEETLARIALQDLNDTDEETSMSFGELGRGFLKCRQEIYDSFNWLDDIRDAIAISEENLKFIPWEERGSIAHQLASYGLLRP